MLWKYLGTTFFLIAGLESEIPGCFDICKLIIGIIDDKNPEVEWGSTPLHFAAKFGRLEICRLILGYIVSDANPRDNEERTPFDLAEKNGHSEIAQLFNAKRYKTVWKMSHENNNSHPTLS